MNTEPRRVAESARRRWMGILARARTPDLEALWDALEPPPAYGRARGPETGLVMVRGRAGGVGQRFNLGEMTLTRCVVRLDGGPAGHAYVAGRDARHAELAAVFDALLRDGRMDPAVIDRLAAEQVERRDARAAKTAATRVDFFTMVRGED